MICRSRLDSAVLQLRRIYALDRHKVIKECVVTNVFGVKKNCRGLGVERTVCVVKIAELLGWND